MPTPLNSLTNVTVKLKANVYFDGGVISHTVLGTDKIRRTIGVIRPGRYHFTTDAPELMDIISGSCRVQRKGDKEPTVYKEGESFRVDGQSAFDIEVKEGLTEYLCTFE